MIVEGQRNKILRMKIYMYFYCSAYAQIEMIIGCSKKIKAISSFNIQIYFFKYTSASNKKKFGVFLLSHSRKSVKNQTYLDQQNATVTSKHVSPTRSNDMCVLSTFRKDNVASETHHMVRSDVTS